MKISPEILLKTAFEDGLEIALNADGKISVQGKSPLFDDYLKIIRESKPEIVDYLKQQVIQKDRLLDDRHSCLECSNLTLQNWCREATKYGKFVAWIDSEWLDKKHRCERFAVKSVRH
ncbi:MAG: hypothetical protein RLZZ601_1737 [Pseudomonadota bacterium]|jgi:hypothetical protein